MVHFWGNRTQFPTSFPYLFITSIKIQFNFLEAHDSQHSHTSIQINSNSEGTTKCGNFTPIPEEVTVSSHRKLVSSNGLQRNRNEIYILRKWYSSGRQCAADSHRRRCSKRLNSGFRTRRRKLCSYLSIYVSIPLDRTTPRQGEGKRTTSLCWGTIWYVLEIRRYRTHKNIPNSQFPSLQAHPVAN